MSHSFFFLFFFFNDTATTEIYTLSLHDALPIYGTLAGAPGGGEAGRSCEALRCALLVRQLPEAGDGFGDRKSTRLNSSHSQISYAVFCLKKKKNKKHKKKTLREKNKINTLKRSQ